MNLYRKFVEVALQYPDNICMTDHTGTYSYRYILDKINRYREKLNSIKNKRACVIYLPKSADIIVWQLAINANDLAFVTLEYGQPARLASVIEKCQPSLVITQEGLDFLEGIEYRCSYMVFSSGSTGEPKKIMLNDEPVIEVVLEQARITQMDSTKTSLWILNASFDASLSDIYMTLLVGGHLVITDVKPSDVKAIANIVEKYQITHTDMPPVVFPIWLKFIKKNSSSLKHIIFGGEKADEKIVLELLDYCDLYNAYGPTETTICTSLCKVGKNWNSQDIGMPLKGVLYKIVDNQLHIGGSHCAIGYDNFELDKKFYIEQDIKWFISGDIVEYKKTYLYLGRVDRQFKHYGQLICPEEIESAALKCGAQKARVSYIDKKILLKHTGSFNKEKLNDYLPQWMVPHRFEETDLNINSNWKVVG